MHPSANCSRGSGDDLTRMGLMHRMYSTVMHQIHSIDSSWCIVMRCNGHSIDSSRRDAHCALPPNRCDAPPKTTLTPTPIPPTDHLQRDVNTCCCCWGMTKSPPTTPRTKSTSASTYTPITCCDSYLESCISTCCNRRMLSVFFPNVCSRWCLLSVPPAATEDDRCVFSYMPSAERLLKVNNHNCKSLIIYYILNHFP